jgi:hypothetical protein
MTSGHQYVSTCSPHGSTSNFIRLRDVFVVRKLCTEANEVYIGRHDNLVGVLRWMNNMHRGESSVRIDGMF